MMPVKRLTKRTNTNLIANRAMSVMFKTIQWQAKPVTLEDIRKQVQEKVRETLTR